MIRIIPILLIVTNSILAFGQLESERLKKFDIHIGFGVGTKSHVGNCGLTSNLFLLKNFNVKTSIGIGIPNYNGPIFSCGPEFCFAISKKCLFSFGSTWTYAGKYQDIIGDDNSQDYIWYFTGRNQYIRSFIGIGIGKTAITKIELGYSYAIYTSTYSFDGPGIPTSKQISNISKGLNSGISICCSICGILNLKK